jgi:Putative MetA-pathway of phenol degradation
MPPVRLILPTRQFMAVLAACMLAGSELPACAQDIEPRAYSNAPVGVNFLIAGYAYTRGGVAFGPSLPITNPHLDTSSAVVAYATTLDLWGMSGKFDATVPYTRLSGTADYMGQTVARNVSGFANSAFRLSINFYGAPALTPKEFADYEQDLIIGASLRVVAPWSQYDASKLVNIGTNNWSFKPQFGISKAIGPWTLEGTAAVTFYTGNNDFFGGRTLAESPLYALQGHLIYGFRSGIWASLDATYFSGGRSTVNGVLNSDLQQNWRIGATLAFPVNRENSIKWYASKGVAARTGDNYDLIGVAWQYRWGGGL